MGSVRQDARRLEALLDEVATRFAEVWPDRAGRDFHRTRIEPLRELVNAYAREAARFERELAESMNKLP